MGRQGKSTQNARRGEKEMERSEKPRVLGEMSCTWRLWFPFFLSQLLPEFVLCKMATCPTRGAGRNAYVCKVSTCPTHPAPKSAPGRAFTMALRAASPFTSVSRRPPPPKQLRIVRYLMQAISRLDRRPFTPIFHCAHPHQPHCVCPLPLPLPLFAEIQHRDLARGVARRQPLPAPVPCDLEDVAAAVCGVW